jgi:hypothetical protein
MRKRKQIVAERLAGVYAPEHPRSKIKPRLTAKVINALEAASKNLGTRHVIFSLEDLPKPPGDQAEYLVMPGGRSVGRLLVTGVISGEGRHVVVGPTRVRLGSESVIKRDLSAVAKRLERGGYDVDIVARWHSAKQLPNWRQAKFMSPLECGPIGPIRPPRPKPRPGTPTGKPDPDSK